MRCPFLREAQVKSCRASSCRKMIAQVAGQSATERCSTSAYAECPAAKPLIGEDAILDQCPYLHDSLVQFCGAASLTKYIPYSEEVLSHCGTDSHKYCELFLAFAQPQSYEAHAAPGARQHPASAAEKEVSVDGIRVRTDLMYTPNHMWVEVSEDRTVHVGIDALLAGLLGQVDQISYVTPRGIQRPAVVFTVHGTDLPVILPHKMSITGVNAALRTYPSRLFADPYTRGWLFEGTDLELAASPGGKGQFSSLVSGAEAVEWMREELHHVSEVVHDLSHASCSDGVVLMADGGNPQPGVAQQLNRDDLLHLFNELFSPLAGWRKP